MVSLLLHFIYLFLRIKKVIFIRFVHSPQWWSSCWYCHFWTQSSLWLPQYSWPSFTLPKTTCLPSNHSVLAAQMKSCKPFVLGPVFATDKMPGPVYFRMKFLSSNFSPSMDLPPVPLWHVKSPPWHINPEIILLKQDLSFAPNAQIMKVFHCLWNFVCKQLKGDVVQRLAVVSGVEEHSGTDHSWAI